jgi:hypothetical protein
MFTDPMAFVVSMNRLISGGYSKNGTIRSQLLRHDFTTVG